MQSSDSTGFRRSATTAGRIRNVDRVSPELKYSFPPRYRLRTRKDFSALRRGRSLVVGGLKLIYRRNGLDHARIGFAISRRYGNAVRRNRLKRQLRECFRLNGIRRQGVDILVVPVCDWKGMRNAGQAMKQGLERIRMRLERTGT